MADHREMCGSPAVRSDDRKYLQDAKAEYDAGQGLYPALLSREDVLSDIHGWIDQRKEGNP